VNVTILGSGSRGNALVIDVEGSRVLVDAGFNAKTLASRMRLAEIAPESIGALILTHEHTDHVSGACTAARKWGWTVYATPGTIAATPGLQALRPLSIDPQASIALDRMEVRCMRTPHDAREPIGMVVHATTSGTRLGIAYDLGHVPAGVEAALRDLDALILEANHDDEMLRAGPYPVVVQNRIAGANGHLSNRAASDVGRRVAHRGLRHLVLAHLSANNNSAAVARQTMDAALRSSAFRGSLTVARQDALTCFSVERARRVEQLTLF